MTVLLLSVAVLGALFGALLTALFVRYEARRDRRPGYVNHTPRRTK